MELLEIVGKVEVAWEERLHVLPHLDEIGPVIASFCYGEMSVAARRLQQTDVARALQEKTIDHAFATREPHRITIALRYLADLLIESGELNAAVGVQEDAKRFLATVENKGQQQSVQQLIDELEGRIYAVQAPRQSRAAFSRAIGIARDKDATTALIPLLVRRAKVLRALGEPGAAERDLREALAHHDEAWRDALAPTAAPKRAPILDDTAGYLDGGREILDALVALLADAGRFDEAFLVTERARTNAWRRALHGTEIDPRGVGDDLVAALGSERPPDRILVSYWLLEDRILIWHLDASGLRCFSARVDRGLLGNRVKRLVDGFNRRRFRIEIRNDLEWLDRVLIDPIRPFLSPEQKITIVSDGALHGVPFAALGSKKAFLIESHPISMVPNATLAVLSWRQQRTAKPIPTPSVLTLSPVLASDRFRRSGLSETRPALRRIPGGESRCRSLPRTLLARRSSRDMA